MTDTPIRTAQEALEAAATVILSWADGRISFDAEILERRIRALSDRIQPTTLPDPEAIALPTEGELVALIERTLDVHDDWNIPPSHSVARAILALVKGEG